MTRKTTTGVPGRHAASHRAASHHANNNHANSDQAVVGSLERFAQVLAVGGLSLVLVVALLRPADSVEVERGAALLLVPLVVGTWVASLFAWPQLSWIGGCRTERWFNALLVAWLAWLLMGTFSVAGEGNARHAVNEFWWWVSGVMLLVAARNCLARVSFIGPVHRLLLALMVGVCAFAAHQQLVSLPNDRALYEQDPERVLAAAGIDAPAGSPKRMLFESRLYGGGVSGTFALANSLAGFLVLCLPMVLGEIALGWKARRQVGVALWALIAVVVVLVLVWADSQSAYLSLIVGTLFGIVLTGLQVRGGQSSTDQGPSLLSSLGMRFGRPIWLMMFFSAGVAVFVLTLMPGLWSSVPRSLAFRFQYWNATLRMLVERPWFGAGPGNFQQRYGTYRLDEASEGIADPHNWIMEILGVGGFIGLVLCVGIGLVAVLGLKRLRGDEQEVNDARNQEEELGMRAASPVVMTVVVGIAALIGIVGVIASWIATLSLPDFDAILLLVVVTFGCFGLGTWLENGRVPQAWRFRRNWMIAGLTAVGIHLLASGGLTVPGVAVPIILVAGYVLSDQRTTVAPKSENTRMIRLGTLVIAAALLLAWQWTAWGPTSQAAGWMRAADDAVAAGYVDQGIEYYEMAAEADRLDPQPLIRESETLLWAAVATQSEAAAKDLLAKLSQVNERAIQREPGSAQWHELRGRQRVVLYQRFGDEEDLEMARAGLARAMELSPGEVGWAVQLALVEAKLAEIRGEAAGRASEAVRWAGRAETLSAAGGHADRSLEVVNVLQVEFVGERMVREGPQVNTAGVLLREILAEN